MAERVGFEPTVPVKAQQFSRLPDSTTLAPLRESLIIRVRLVKYQAAVSGVRGKKPASVLGIHFPIRRS